MRRRKGQAALEYLVTYGWGILAILVVVGALAYFGLFEPSRYLPDHCSFGAQLQCADYQVVAGDGASNGGVVYLRLRNGFGDGITITNAYVGDVAADIGTESSSKGALDIIAGNYSNIIAITLPIGVADVVENDRQPLSLVLEFQRTSPEGPKHNVSGEIFGSALSAGSDVAEDPPIFIPPES